MSTNICCICREGLADGNEFGSMSCGHVIHTECYIRARSYHMTHSTNPGPLRCPLCKTNVYEFHKLFLDLSSCAQCAERKVSTNSKSNQTDNLDSDVSSSGEIAETSFEQVDNNDDLMVCWPDKVKYKKRKNNRDNDFKSKYLEAKKKISEMEKTLKSERESLDEQRAENTRLNSESNHVRGRLNHEIVTHDNEIKRLMSEMKTLKVALEQCKTDLKESEDRIQDLENDIKRRHEQYVQEFEELRKQRNLYSG